MFLSLIFLKFSCSLSALRSWTSVESSLVSAEHKVTPKNSSEFWMDEVEYDLWCALGSLDGSDDILF